MPTISKCSEFIARGSLVLSDGRSKDLELQAKLQQALAEEYSLEGTTPPVSSGDSFVSLEPCTLTLASRCYAA